MRRLTALYMLVACTTLSAQTPFDTIHAPTASLITEEVQIFTDRSIYVVGERILFSAHNRVVGLDPGSRWSALLYMELVTAEGRAVAQGKYRFVDAQVSASLAVPTSLLTGNYYLKCYTRWMRNAGPDIFSYTPLKIINPNRPEVVANTNGVTQSSPLPRSVFRQGEFTCTTTSSQFQGGSEVLLQLNGPSNAYLEQLNCCVTVVPEGAIDSFLGAALKRQDPAREMPFRVNYLPDRSSGISLSGSVTGPDRKAVPYANLHFSQLGERPDFFAAMTDENGRFVLSSSISDGKHEFFVTPEEEEKGMLEVHIDQDFDGRSLTMPAGAFHLTITEREVARKMALHAQLSKVYGDTIEENQEALMPKPGSVASAPFYGTSVKQLFIDDYVNLPNLEEVFINLVPDVQFYRKHGKERIRIMSDNNSIGVYDPLIMIDHISVFDQEALLALSPDKIERIDLITDIYLKGSVAFGGVLAIYSIKGDMAGVDLPKGSYFFDLQSTESILPLPSFTPHPGKRIPDTRNTVFWLDGVELKQGARMEIPFHAPTTAGEYRILVRGVSPTGELFSATTHFTVE